MGDVNTTAGWYADPEYPLLRRYWDGERWTSHTTPRPPESPDPVYTELVRLRRASSRLWSALATAALLALFVVVMLRIDALVN